jgi:hypothetical protein
MAHEAPEVEIASNAGDPTDIRNITGSVSLPTGASTAARQDTGNSSLSSIDTKTPSLVSGRVPVDGSAVTQPISAASLPLPTGASTLVEQQTQSTRLGSLTETAPANDTDSSGLNGRLQRIAQRITTLISTVSTEVTLAALNAKIFSTTSAPANNALGLVVRPVSLELPTFSVADFDIAVANNKSMLALQNTGTSIVRVREIWIINDRTTAATGVAGEFQVNRITSFTGGTALTPVSYDTIDTLPAGVTAATNATVAGEGAILRRGRWSTDEWGPGTADVESFDHALQNIEPFWKQTPNGKALTIRQNQGIHVKFATNSTAGSFTIRMIFTTE